MPKNEGSPPIGPEQEKAVGKKFRGQIRTGLLSNPDYKKAILNQMTQGHPMLRDLRESFPSNTDIDDFVAGQFFRQRSHDQVILELPGGENSIYFITSNISDLSIDLKYHSGDKTDRSGIGITIEFDDKIAHERVGPDGYVDSLASTYGMEAKPHIEAFLADFFGQQDK